MDSIVSAALEEICAQGGDGISILDLWPRLQASLSSGGLHPCDGVKSAIWNRILNMPGLQFKLPESSTSISSEDPSIQSFEESEKLRLKVVAAEHLRDSFVGLYDIKAADAGISDTQRRALERLASARTNGITQSQLAKEFGMKGNNIFYIVRNLECRGLIVRQSTIVRTKEPATEGESGLKSTSVVNTNLIHLYRYSKHLSSHQRLEITKADTLDNLGNSDKSTSAGDGITGECVKDDVLIKDYLPALKAVCDKLEEADGQVLVVADVKKVLGYRKTPGHRAWRNICNRLKDARLVEEVEGEVDKKVVKCLRLLKKFDPKSFQPKSIGCGNDDFETDQSSKCGKRGQITDQLAELPIEHQVYDMIDASGLKGLTVTEVCKQLGINSKRNYTRLLNLFSRFRMHLQAESHNRGMAYRVWTSGNFNHCSSTAFLSKSGIVLDGNELSIQSRGDLDHLDGPAPNILQLDSSTPNDELTTPGKVKSGELGLELCHDSPGNDESQQLHMFGSNPQGIAHESGDTVPDAELDLVNMVTELNIAASETFPPTSASPSKLRSCQRYPCLTLTANTALRKRRILDRLQEEKFILTVELYRWLESLDKDKSTTMARKTLTRILNNLQQEGLCKCVQVSVPVVTNCGRRRMTEVVLLPSFQTIPPEVLSQIHERLRSFDMQSRGQGLARLKNDKSVPVLTGVQRTQNCAASDDQAARSEAMRANGFVLAKMVRAKLLHNFLWDYLNSLPGWDDALSSGKQGYDLKNTHSTCKLFALDAAIKAMKLELFLQVVGSTLKFEDLVENCKRGLCLSDIPVQEYKCLMNTQATGRLSGIVDILRRLKLIRLVTDGHTEETDGVPHATLTHAMELRPYIEEPVSIVPPTSHVSSLDFRPRIRHDFILSNREAVDAYWKTLEYCFAAADPTAASHAFPGSAVQEVFLPRSWASVRVMTADQRAELLKHIFKDDPSKKLSFKDCEKIARDLNLTFEQVLRVYSDKRQQRLNRFQRDLNNKDREFQAVTSKRRSASRKRKRVSEAKSSRYVKIDTVAGERGKERLPVLSDTDGQYVEEQNHSISSGEHDVHLQACDEEESGPNEEDEEENCAFISQCAFSKLKPTRQRKFLWTETSDRKLVIQYVKHRATLGARFNRTDWASLPDLPAPPSACRRRMALLNTNLNFRKALMGLCNVLGKRYGKHLDQMQESEIMSPDGCSLMVQDSSLEEVLNGNHSTGLENTMESDSVEQRWDDFEDPDVKMVLDEVLRCTRMAKLEASRRGRFIPEKEWPDLNLDTQTCNPQEDHAMIPSTIPGEEVQSHVGIRRKFSGRRSSCHRVPGKFLKLLNEGISVNKRAYDSLAVSNAVELLKLVFLSTSTAPEVPNLLAETLRRYSQHDLFAAFNYLREKKFMVGGNSSQPFVLSQQFLQSISSSPFPTNTGKRAARFASWISEREKDLMEEGIDLNTDLQCGDIFHLFALVSSGELLISPCLPDEGIGDSEETRGLKRKTDKDELCNSEMAKKSKSLLTKDGEFCCRREKGFPGILVSVIRATFSKADAVELFKNEEIHTSPVVVDENDRSNTFPGLEIGSSSSLSNHLNPSHNFGSVVPIAGAAKESPWEAMTSYAQHLISTLTVQEQVGSFYPEVFQTVHSIIHKAGDQGLCLEEVSEVMDMQGRKTAELIVDVLQAFGLIILVNAYDRVHVVDALYRSKYFLTPVTGRYQNLKPAHHGMSPGVGANGYLTLLPENHENSAGTSYKEMGLNSNNLHKVTIINLPEEVSRSSNEVQSNNEFEDNMLVKVVSLETANESESFECVTSGGSHSSKPILPWINGDGTTNTIVYKGLTRRVLGTVMQNPGILEDDLIQRMDVLNPQSCRKLLELMVLDNHLIVRKMHQTTSDGPPGILGGILRSSLKKSELICREHFFANPMSTFLL